MGLHVLLLVSLAEMGMIEAPSGRPQVFKLVDAKRVVTWNFYFTKLMPIGLFMAATLHFGNLVYLYLTVSFIQMLKVRGAQGSGRDRQLILRCLAALCHAAEMVCRST